MGFYACWKLQTKSLRLIEKSAVLNYSMKFTKHLNRPISHNINQPHMPYRCNVPHLKQIISLPLQINFSPELSTHIESRIHGNCLTTHTHTHTFLARHPFLPSYTLRSHIPILFYSTPFYSIPSHSILSIKSSKSKA